MALIVWFHGRSVVTNGWLATLALGLLLGGGAIGNLIDRMRLGYVVDFVDMGVGDLRFYTYNVADAAISTSLLLLIVMASGLARRRTPATPGASADDGAPPRRPGWLGWTRGPRRLGPLGPLAEPGPAPDRRGARPTVASPSRRHGGPAGCGAVLDVEVPAPVPADIEPEAIPLEVLYEDPDVLVVNKPAGLVVHPSPGHWSGTMVNALLARDTEYGGIAGVQRPGIVHRLDRDTSGLIMVAKTDAAQASLMAQLKARRVKKTYLALVQGASRRPPAGSRRRSGAIRSSGPGWPWSPTVGRP